MNDAVEILVAEGAVPLVGRELRSLQGVSVRSSPSPRASVHRLLVAWLDDLSAAAGVRQVEHLLGQVRDREWSAGLPVVLSGWRRAPAFASPVDPIPSAMQVLHQLVRQTWVQRRCSESYVAPDWAALRRLANARVHNAEGELIASAALLGRELLVWSCEPTLYRISVDEVPALAELDADTLHDFAVSASGSRIRWDRADVDLNLDTVREKVDPSFRKRNEQRARREAAGFGAAIRKLRLDAGLKQTEVPGLSEREIRRLERGGIVPRAETLRLLAAAHQTSPGEYLEALARLASQSST
ncbi:MAG TPA: helix-turn-helix domain-containing protein [Polyangia bacterium]|jgi:hypothetical protein